MSGACSAETVETSREPRRARRLSSSVPTGRTIGNEGRNSKHAGLFP
jgi:hypothetical protein